MKSFLKKSLIVINIFLFCFLFLGIKTGALATAITVVWSNPAEDCSNSMRFNWQCTDPTYKDQGRSEEVYRQLSPLPVGETESRDAGEHARSGEERRDALSLRRRLQARWNDPRVQRQQARDLCLRPDGRPDPRPFLHVLLRQLWPECPADPLYHPQGHGRNADQGRQVIVRFPNASSEQMLLRHLL